MYNDGYIYTYMDVCIYRTLEGLQSTTTLNRRSSVRYIQLKERREGTIRGDGRGKRQRRSKKERKGERRAQRGGEGRRGRRSDGTRRE